MPKFLLTQRTAVLKEPPSWKWKVLSITLDLIVAAFILLWIYTGLFKLLDYEQTRFQMGRSPFIQPIAGFVSVAVPVAELMVAALLLFRKFRTIGLFASFYLMLLFTGYVYAMLHYSYYLPCSCGGVLNALSWEDHLVFNIIFTVMALVGIFFNVRQSQ